MTVPDGLSARLRATFIGELEEQVVAMNTALLALEQQPSDSEQIRVLFRVAHTVKGAARAAAVTPVELACHALETFLARARDGSATLGAPQFAALFAGADALVDAATKLRAGQELTRGIPINTWFLGFDANVGEMTSRPRTTARPSASRSIPDAGAQASSSAAPNATPPAVLPEASQSAALPDVPLVARKKTADPLPSGEVPVRVDAGRLDALMATAGQLLGTRRDASEQADDLESLRLLAARSTAEWKHTTRRLRVALGQLVDTPEAQRSLQRTEEQLREFAVRTERLTTRTQRQLRALDTLTDDVLDQVRHLRMRPFADACAALPRVVRDVAGDTKQVRFEITGGDVEADRAVLDGLREALLHLVRNAVDHGIESPEQRIAAGKSPEGIVAVSAAMRGDRVIVTVSDDGAGIDAAAVRGRMEGRGLHAADDDAVAAALFTGNLSTRATPTSISGRGVGMDLVRAALERVRGTVALTWTEGRGTTVTMTCPPSLASMRAVLMTCGHQTIAIPTSDVERLLRISTAALQHIEGRRVVMVEDVALPLAALAHLLPPIVVQPLGTHTLIALVAVGPLRVGLIVDELLSEEEILLQPLSDGERRSPLLSGAAILGSGTIALVLDAAAAAEAALESSAQLPESTETTGRDRRFKVLVVDDSITTRALEQGILEAAGYDVRTAVDGADGWRCVQEFVPDLVVSDIEMPRMDGFALCETIRHSARFRDLPVVLVTALESPEHRARGLDVGADAYLGKSTFDQRGLLHVIEELLT
ncbi:putative chemotaxis protein CheA [Gemmatimonas aurantiaca T-27]|uniref:histidine kinase n=2 Tax=Gemmatimonas aurantiaca TaxID=173480 RepID=C1A820_GEMAT|nr:response regulator [Gemmatimonas aurantiaca]BAH38380.1 putative chemotaxis protein CheA [Gemmatimonas aurantiaca T-27]